MYTGFISIRIEKKVVIFILGRPAHTSLKSHVPKAGYTWIFD